MWLIVATALQLKHLPLLLQVQQTGDVIAFYNSVFVPAVKTHLLRINQDRASLAMPPPTEGLVGASPIRPFNRYASSASAVSCHWQHHLCHDIHVFLTAAQLPCILQQIGS